MRRSFTTITDLRDEMADTMQLDPAAVTAAIRANHSLFSDYGTITAREYSAIARAVWEDVTGEPYPADWQQADDRRIDEEEEERYEERSRRYEQRVMDEDAQGAAIWEQYESQREG